MIIETADQYKSICRMLLFMENIGITCAEKTHYKFVQQEGPMWNICEFCEEPPNKCFCDDASLHSMAYAAYDDEASFE